MTQNTEVDKRRWRRPGLFGPRYLPWPCLWLPLLGFFSLLLRNGSYCVFQAPAVPLSKGSYLETPCCDLEFLAWAMLYLLSISFVYLHLVFRGSLCSAFSRLGVQTWGDNFHPFLPATLLCDITTLARIREGPRYCGCWREASVGYSVAALLACRRKHGLSFLVKPCYFSAALVCFLTHISFLVAQPTCASSEAIYYTSLSYCPRSGTHLNISNFVIVAFLKSPDISILVFKIWCIALTESIITMLEKF